MTKPLPQDAAAAAVHLARKHAPLAATQTAVKYVHRKLTASCAPLLSDQCTLPVQHPPLIQIAKDESVSTAMSQRTNVRTAQTEQGARWNDIR